MKKSGIMTVLLTAGTFAAAGLFAQEIKFDGYVNSGLGVVYSTEDGAADPFIAASAGEAGSNAFRIRLHAAYTNEAGNAGAFLRLQAAGGYNTLTLPAAYGWFSALNNILNVKGGIVDDGTWNTGGVFFNSDVGEGLGALVKISPVSGLDIGVGAYLAETPAEGQNNQLFADHHELKGGKYYARDFDEAKYTFSLGYTLPDVVKFVASFRAKSEAGTGANADGSGFTSDILSSRLRAGVSLLTVPNLKANVELELDNLQDFSGLKNGEKDAWDRIVGPWDHDNDSATEDKVTLSSTAASGKITITETVQYDLGSLSVGLWAVEWLSQAENTDFALYVNPWVSYALGSIVPRLDLGYGSGAQASFNNSNLNWYRTNYGPVYDSDVSVISIRPSVKLNIDSKTFVEIGDLIDLDGKKAGWGDADSRISNLFYVDFRWTF
jgi:hypothetical protein